MMKRTLDEFNRNRERLKKAKEKGDTSMAALWGKIEVKLKENLEKQNAWLKGKDIGGDDDSLLGRAKSIFGGKWEND